MPLPSPVDLPDPGIEPRSPTLQKDYLPSEPPGIAIIIKDINNNCRLGYGEKWTLVHCGKFVQLRWKILWKFLKKFKIELPYDMDRGSWWATVHRVTKSQACLKRLSMHAYMKGQLHSWMYIPKYKSTNSKRYMHLYVHKQHYLQLPRHGSNLSVHHHING